MPPLPPVCAADWLPISIPNKILSDLIISNESRIESSNEVIFYNRYCAGFDVSKRSIKYADSDLWSALSFCCCRMRTFHFEAKIRYQVSGLALGLTNSLLHLATFFLKSWKVYRAALQDFEVVESILEEYKAYLKSHPLVDKTLPVHVCLSAYEEDGLKIAVSVRPCAKVEHTNCHCQDP